VSAPLHRVQPVASAVAANVASVVAAVAANVAVTAATVVAVSAVAVGKSNPSDTRTRKAGLNQVSLFFEFFPIFARRTSNSRYL